LTRWNDERGFGFITLPQGGPEIFVHISAFARNGTRPAIDELISFDIEQGSDGKQRAVRVQRPQRRSDPRPQPRAGRFALAPLALALAALCIAGAYIYTPVLKTMPEYVALPEPLPQQEARPPAEPPVARRAPPVARVQPVSYTCDGRNRCSQMTSCAEATYFLHHCPAQQTDGDHDGIPCEHQWCE